MPLLRQQPTDSLCIKTLQSVQNDALFLYYLADVLPRNRLFLSFVAFLLPESDETCPFGRYKRQFHRNFLISSFGTIVAL